MLRIATGLQYVPRAANAAYAEDIASGDSVLGPSVKDSTESRSSPLACFVMPSRLAIVTTSHRPTRFCSWRKYVLTDSAVARRMSYWPFSRGLSL
jgi:hypothetical protein